MLVSWEPKTSLRMNFYSMPLIFPVMDGVDLHINAKWYLMPQWNGNFINYHWFNPSSWHDHSTSRYVKFPCCSSRKYGLGAAALPWQCGTWDSWNGDDCFVFSSPTQHNNPGFLQFNIQVEGVFCFIRIMNSCRLWRNIFYAAMQHQFNTVCDSLSVFVVIV